MIIPFLKMAFQSTMRVPYMARFFVYARRFTSDEVSVRVLCLTEPERAENPLELIYLLARMQRSQGNSQRADELIERSRGVRWRTKTATCSATRRRRRSRWS